MVDQVENFVRVSVNGKHKEKDTTIELEPSQTQLLPSINNGKYNLIWYDAGNFANPDEDDNVEIIRVNSIDTVNDTISVSRGQENTIATPKNRTNGQYELLLAPTAKTIQDIDSEKLDSKEYTPESDTHQRYTDSEAQEAVNELNIARNSFTQVINVPVTNSASDGEHVGYKFAIDNETVVSIKAKADGDGGIKDDPDVFVNGKNVRLAHWA